jgi:Mn2+/Fe2+ NRAMP family transporter
VGLLLTLITGLVIWVVLWATGTKSLDAFLIPLLLMVIAVAVHMLVPHIPGRRSNEDL